MGPNPIPSAEFINWVLVLRLTVPNTDLQNLEETILFDWDSYERPQKKWSKEFYSSVIVMAFLASVILYFIEGIMPVLVIWAMVFMLWAMGRTEPRMEKYAISSWGLKTKERTYRFEEMNNFWFETKWGGRLMRLNLIGAPWHLVIVINHEDEDKIRKIMLQYLTYQEPTVTAVDRLVKWLGDKIPLE
jgi:type IV secretory pathway VirB3-like protein